MGVLAKAAELYGHKTIAAITATALASGPVQASKDDAKAALEALKGFLERNDHQWSVAVMLALMLWDADSAVARLRRDGFHRIRHYGLLANALRRENLARARDLLHTPEHVSDKADATSAPTYICRCCGAAMRVVEILTRQPPTIRAPP